MEAIEKTEIYHISQGNELAFSHFIDHYSPRLYYHVYGMVGVKEVAEEIVSDVFVTVWDMRKRLDRIENMSGWLNTLAYRRSVDYLRSKSRARRELSLSDDDFRFPVMQSPADSMISQEELGELQRAIDQLPPKCRHVFLLAKIEEMSYADIAQLLDISVATVNYHIVYAMNALSKTLNRIKKLQR